MNEHRKKKPDPSRSLSESFREWLKQNGLSVDHQTHDTDPIKVLRCFPRPGDDNLTEEHMSSQLWWWRRLNENGVKEIFHQGGNSYWPAILWDVFRDHFERSAYLYELRARYKGRCRWEFDYPWVSCSLEQRKLLACLWPSLSPPEKWLPIHRGQERFMKVDKFHFNLELNDSVLISQFMEEIQRHRQRLGISRPPAGKGTRRKPISWRAIESMDKRYLLQQGLTDSERSQVNKTIKEYERACSEAKIAP